MKQLCLRIADSQLRADQLATVLSSYIYSQHILAVGGLQAFPPVNIAPDINMDLAPPLAKKVRSEADDLVPEQQFIAGHPVRNTVRWIKSIINQFPLCNVLLPSAHG